MEETPPSRPALSQVDAEVTPIDPGQGRDETSEKIRNALLAIPQFGKLMWRLIRDPRVPRRNKLVFGGIFVYLFSPVDLIPDWLPGIGRIDDILLVALGLNAMLNEVPDEVIAEHWEGDQDALELVRSILSMASLFVPEGIRERLFENDDEDHDEER